MHEFSIAMSLLEAAEAETRRLGAVQVRAVIVRIGPLAGVDVQALRTAFRFAQTTSPLSGAELAIEDAPLSAFCPRCGKSQPVRSVQEWICGQCGDVAGELATGRELDLIGLEVE